MAISDEEIRNVVRSGGEFKGAAGEVIIGLLDRIYDLQGQVDDLEQRVNNLD